MEILKNRLHDWSTNITCFLCESELKIVASDITCSGKSMFSNRSFSTWCLVCSKRQLLSQSFIENIIPKNVLQVIIDRADRHPYRK